MDATGAVEIQALVKRNTALANFVFLMTDSTTHNPKPGLGTGISSSVSIDGAAFVSTTNTATEISNGYYKIDLAAADVNGSVITLRFTATASDDLGVGFTTVP